MNGKEILTEYFEDEMAETSAPKFEDDVVFIEAPADMREPNFEVNEGPKSGQAYVVSFSEDDLPALDLESDSVNHADFNEDLITEEAARVEQPLDMNTDTVYEEESALESLSDESGEPEISSGRFIPGVENFVPESEAEDTEELEDEVIESSWVEDRDTSKFIDYLRESYSGVPKHNGNSISGCERALVYLNGLNREVSEAVRKDTENNLDEHLDEIEDFRVNIIQGMVALKTRIGELRKKIKEEGSQRKRSSDDSDELTKEGSIEKIATTAQIQLVMTPFERAISGILINSVVSAGHPFEDVYDYLKDKFELTPREELAIIQVVMDMGYPIFKDRGIIGTDAKGDGKGHGIDFIKNYLA